MLKLAIYPIFGVLVIFGYASAVRRGIDPGAVRSEDRVAPQGAPRQASSRGHYRRPSYIWLGGFGGK